MDIDYLREFVVLSETGNFLEAADQLFISQSALSRHIKSLEDELGVAVFDRTTRRVVLNQYGRLLLPYAKEIDRIHYEYTTAFYNELNGEHGNVRVGAIPVMAQYHITDVLARFQKENANFSMDVIEADSLQLVKMLRSNQCDFAFLREWDDSDNEFNKIPFTTDNMAALMPLDHPLAKEESLQLGQLYRDPLLLLARDTFMYSLCVQKCREAGFEPHIAFTGHRAENIVDLVSKGMGVALLMKKPVLYMERKDIAIVDVQPLISTTISLAYAKNTRMSSAAAHFLNLVKAI